MNQQSLLLDPANPRLNYGPTQINRPHVFTANIVYDVPTMRGSNPFVRTALGGWELSTILSYASGSSLTTYGVRAADGAPGGLNGSGANQDSLRPNLVPGEPCRARGGPKNQWLNPNRYTLVGYTIGAPTGTASVGDCLSPGIANTDLGVFKNFKAGERVTVQFRMDFFNLFNKVQFRGNSQGFYGISTNLDSRAVVTGGEVTSYIPDPNYGVANVDKGPREIQYGLHISF